MNKVDFFQKHGIFEKPRNFENKEFWKPKEYF